MIYTGFTAFLLWFTYPREYTAQGSDNYLMFDVHLNKNMFSKLSFNYPTGHLFS